MQVIILITALKSLVSAMQSRYPSYRWLVLKQALSVGVVGLVISVTCLKHSNGVYPVEFIRSVC